jgi:outer membrane lipoprotein-sorting protein
MPATRRALILAGAAFATAQLLAPLAFAQSPEELLVQDAVAYLDGINNIKARFTQTDAKGDVAQGTLYLARPGRARFEYDPPSTLLITSDGTNVVLTDSRLKTHQQFPLKSTPLALFLADHIRLDKGARIQRVDRSPEGFSITAQDGHGLAQGQVTLYFERTPIRLSGWAIVDPQGRLTRVTLEPFQAIPSPADAFFTQPPSPPM